MSQMTLYTLIMAGGKGERFWPLSTPEHPKPFLRLFSDRSLLQQTYDRALKLSAADHVFLIVGNQHAAVSREQLPELPPGRLLLEPTGRDTAAAIGYASLQLPEDALMLVLPADHLIPDADAFADTVRLAASFLNRRGEHALATFGIKPSRPETNYGYIQARSKENLAAARAPAAGSGRGRRSGPEQRRPAAAAAAKIHPVERFVEKPDRARAEEYVLHGSYYWNSGIFLWRVADIRRQIETHLPELWKSLARIRRTPRSFADLYSRLPKISIDYGVMEKAERVVVIPADFAWDDVGTWNSLTRVLPVDDNSNLVRGLHTGLQTTNCIIYAEDHTIATAGISDLIIVQKGNRTLVCTREYADRLKELLAKLSS